MRPPSISTAKVPMFSVSWAPPMAMDSMAFSDSVTVTSTSPPKPLDTPT